MNRHVSIAPTLEERDPTTPVIYDGDGTGPVQTYHIGADLRVEWLPALGWHHLAALYEDTVNAPSIEGCLAWCILYGLVRALPVSHPTIIEIGVQNGDSTVPLCLAAKALGGRVISMDIDGSAFDRAYNALYPLGLTDCWEFRYGASQTLAPTPSDFLLVDGDHTYPAVSEDMARHGAAVKDGGLLVLDDFHVSQGGKTRWIQERWSMLEPVVIGPFAILRKHATMPLAILKEQPMEWEWRL